MFGPGLPQQTEGGQADSQPKQGTQLYNLRRHQIRGEFVPLRKPIRPPAQVSTNCYPPWNFRDEAFGKLTALLSGTQPQPNDRGDINAFFEGVALCHATLFSLLRRGAKR